MNTEPIVICQLPLSVKPEIAFKDTASDRHLISAIVDYRKDLERQNIEVFKRVNNVIAAETGYFIAFYEKDLDIAENGDGVKAFTGDDGREKVILLDKDDNPVIRDLAELVANEFVPNPNGYLFVGFIDGNSKNCAAENLQWVEKL